MAQELISAFETAADKFYQSFLVFSKEEINSIPFEGSWTAAQVVDHILKSQAGLPKLLTGKTTQADRDPEEKKDSLKKLFLDFTSKLNAPEFIIPTTTPQDKELLLNAIKERKLAIIEAMKANDLTRICIEFELPVFGQLTGREWMWFATYHLLRHTHQLENIYSRIKNVVKLDQ